MAARYSATEPSKGSDEVNLYHNHQEEDDGGKDFSVNSDTVEDSKDADGNNLGDDEKTYKVIVFHVLLINV